MKPFEYRLADDTAGALAVLAATPGARYLGGGTNLVDLMKLGVETPGMLVDVTRLDMGGIAGTEAGGLCIGAAERNSDAAVDPRVRSRYPVLSQALLSGASGQLRNMATVGGNFLQRTRCRYFQDVSKPCNKRAPGTGCPAIEGEHHNLAILGHSPSCVATHPSDMAVAMVALDAVVHLRSADGQRDLPVADMYRLNGDHPETDTNLRAGELITGVTLPPIDARRSMYRKARERATFAFAAGSVAAVLELGPGQTVADVRIALGAVAHKPWRAAVAEEDLRGGPATADAFRSAIDHELEAARPLRDNAYKVPLIRNIVVTTLTRLAHTPLTQTPLAGGQP